MSTTPNGHLTKALRDALDAAAPPTPLEAHLRIVDEHYRAQQRAIRWMRIATWLISIAAIASLIAVAIQIANLTHQWGWW
jgi:hypothetical protein